MVLCLSLSYVHGLHVCDNVRIHYGWNVTTISNKPPAGKYKQEQRGRISLQLRVRRARCTCRLVSPPLLLRLSLVPAPLWCSSERKHVNDFSIFPYANGYRDRLRVRSVHAAPAPPPALRKRTRVVLLVLENVCGIVLTSCASANFRFCIPFGW